MYNNPQDRSNQPGRAGGNSAAKQSEKHNQSKATQIAQGAHSDRRTRNQVKVSSAAATQVAAAASKHTTRLKTWARSLSAARWLVPLQLWIQTSRSQNVVTEQAIILTRLHEKDGQQKATRLDMSTSHRF